jgi:hypothetical protein
MNHTFIHHIFIQKLHQNCRCSVYVLTEIDTGDENYNVAARFWAKIFGLNFAVGVVTGIPMEFQFGQLGRLLALRGRRGRRLLYLARPPSDPIATLSA